MVPRALWWGSERSELGNFISSALLWHRAALRLPMGLRVAILADLAVALDRAAAADHHVAVLGFGHAGHAAGQRDAAVQVARQHRLLLLLGHRPLVEVGALVGLEAGAVFGLHQRHAELVQRIALARLLGVEDGRAG